MSAMLAAGHPTPWEGQLVALEDQHLLLHIHQRAPPAADLTAGPSLQFLATGSHPNRRFRRAGLRGQFRQQGATLVIVE